MLKRTFAIALAACLLCSLAAFFYTPVVNAQGTNTFSIMQITDKSKDIEIAAKKAMGK